MKKMILVASAFALGSSLTVAASAQSGMSMPMPGTPGGTMSATDVGVSPLSGTSATDYVKMAADSDMYEIASSKLALSKSKDAGVKSYARQMITDHTGTTRALMAALTNGDRKIAKPGKMMSATNAANVALLKKAPRASFDQLYMQQQMTSHQTAWALHKGYSTEGTDAALRQVASTAVPIVESHFQHLKTMPMAAPAGGM